MKTLFLKRIAIVALLGLGLNSFMSCDPDIARSKDAQELKDAKDLKAEIKSDAVGKTPNYQMKLSDPLPANIFIELAKKINPAVVNIQVIVGGGPRQQPQGLRGGSPFGDRGQGGSGRQGGPSGRDPFWDFFEDFMGPRGFQQVPPPQQAQGLGTGFVIDASGIILTNNHVVADASDIKVQFAINPDKLYKAEVIGIDPRTDVGLIKIKPDGPLPVAEMGDSDKVEVGEWVAAFGNPYGHTFSMSKGIISAKSRLIRDLNSIPFLQTDASINPGNSGGPLVNLKGEVIAINAAIDARAQGIGFAIPINHVKEILSQLRDKGHVSYGWLGVELAPVTPQARQYLGLPNDNGVVIVGIIPDGPADRAGVKPTDTVIEYNNKKVKDLEDFRDSVMETSIGSKVPVQVIREGKKITLTVKVTENPGNKNFKVRRAQAQPAPKPDMAENALGFRAANFSLATAKQLGVNPPKDLQGPIVVEINEGGIAAQSGLRVGDIILDVNRQHPTAASEVTKLLKSGNNILRVYAGGRTSLIFLAID